MAKTGFIPFKRTYNNDGEISIESICNTTDALNKFLENKVFISAFQLPLGFIIFYETYEQNVIDDISSEIEEINSD